MKINRFKVAVVMPVYNESEGISDFIYELKGYLLRYSPIFIIIDDKSIDATVQSIKKIQSSSDVNLLLLQNSQNMGHGPSTIRAISEGLKIADLIVTIDGDGQFHGKDVQKGLEYFANSNIDILEGVRILRSDPWYRKIITSILKYLVFIKSGKYTHDANTPLRFYKSIVLYQLMRVIPKSSLIPNLYISIHSRRNKFRIAEFKVQSKQRRGSEKSGTTWGRTSALLPNLRLIRFVFYAMKEFLKI